jgi:hypothetical protein
VEIHTIVEEKIPHWKKIGSFQGIVERNPQKMSTEFTITVQG